MGIGAPLHVFSNFQGGKDESKTHKKATENCKTSLKDILLNPGGHLYPTVRQPVDKPKLELTLSVLDLREMSGIRKYKHKDGVPNFSY